MTVPLSRERILDCAVRIADREGLDATSLRKVASELGVHVTSLYNHLPTKDALLDGVGEALMSRADLPPGPVAWEEWVRRFVAEMAALVTEHPGAFEVFQRRPLQGPQALSTFEVALEAFCRAGMTAEESYAALKVVTVAVLGCCAEQAAPVGEEIPSTDVSRLSGKDFPVLFSVIDSAADVDIVATLGEVLVAGLSTLVRRAKKSARLGS